MKRLWVDLGDLGALVRPTHAHERWHNHGQAILMAIAKREGIGIETLSIRSCHSWGEFRMRLKEAAPDVILMNVRSYYYLQAQRVARIAKEINPDCLVVCGGMHGSVALEEMEAVAEFDRVVLGEAEAEFVSILADPWALPRVHRCVGPVDLDALPFADRTAWPRHDPEWPLEPDGGWGPAPVATVLTGRRCPWHCAFCQPAERLHFGPQMKRRSVASVIEELDKLNTNYGPLGSVVFHDSMFFMMPRWLEEFAQLYGRPERRWPFWAAARADTVRRWPELFEELVGKANWQTVSIGFESGSDHVLSILNKECTVADNEFTIDLGNYLGVTWFANIMLAIPGERPTDAFATMRMLGRMERVIPSISYYAPYPGSEMGYRLIAEGKSLMGQDYHRYPGQAKVKGVDYAFYSGLLAGRYDKEVGYSVPRLLAGQGTSGVAPR